jgi:NAD(P)-dependent dehydrogenase (short-subunit alcohol dehydrogenase family)
MDRLEGKTAFITGAANGIGRATAELFVAQGARVVMADIDADSLATAAAELEQESVATVVLDVSDQEQVEKAVAFAQDKFGGLDIAILNAGVPGANLPLEEYPVELFDEVMGINMRGVWLCLRAVVAVMKKRGKGSIVLTSSIQGLSALAGTTAYTTSKHAVVGMMKGAALELAGHGVRVNSVHPGYVETPMMEAIHHAVAPEAPGSFQQAIAGTVPMGRYAKPAEIARLMLFLGSDESSYSTGGTFTADGGILAALPT